LDVSNTRKIGQPRKLTYVTIDVSDLPAELVEPLIDAQGRAAAARAAGSRKAQATVWARKCERVAAWRAINARPRRRPPVTPLLRRILAAAGEWVTVYELRLTLGEGPASVVRYAVDRLWKWGELKKRLNPDRADRPLPAARGVARCIYQFRRAQKETAP
jgi:hypothetical protein